MKRSTKLVIRRETLLVLANKDLCAPQELECGVQ